MSPKDVWPVRWHKEGGFRRWFAWIEAIGLSAGLLSLAAKSTETLPVLVLGGLGLVSVLFVFFWALGWVLVELSTRMGSYSLHPVIAWALAAVVTFPVVVGLVAVLGVIFYGYLR